MLATLLACSLTLSAPPADPTAGKWVIESVTRDGKPDDALKGAVRVHEDGKYTVTPKPDSAAQKVAGTYTVDPNAKPAAIDMRPAEGRYKGKTLLGIYKLEGDTLTVSFAESDKPRPTSFDSKPGSGLVVAVHKRMK